MSLIKVHLRKIKNASCIFIYFHLTNRKSQIQEIHEVEKIERNLCNVELTRKVYSIR